LNSIGMTAVCQMIWHTRWVRTTLDLDDDLVKALLARHPGLSKTEAIQVAMRSYLAGDSRTRLRRIAGTLEVEDASTALRAVDRRT